MNIKNPCLSTTATAFDNNITCAWYLGMTVLLNAAADNYNREGSRGLMLPWAVIGSWCRRARNLPAIPIDRGILQWERESEGKGEGCQGRRLDAPVDDCHLLLCRRAGPAVTKTMRAKSWSFALKRALVRWGRVGVEAIWETRRPVG